MKIEYWGSRMNVKEIALLCGCSAETVLRDLKIIRIKMAYFAMDSNRKNNFSNEEYEQYSIMRRVSFEENSKERGLEAMEYYIYKTKITSFPANYGLTAIINRVDTLLGELTSKK